MTAWAQHLQRLWQRMQPHRSPDQPLAAPAGPSLGLPLVPFVVQQGQPGQWQHLQAQSSHFSLWASTRVGRRHAAAEQACEDSVAACFTPTGALHVALADGVSSGARGDVASAALVSMAVALPVVYPPAPGFAAGSGAEADLQAAHQHLVQRLAQADEQVAQALDQAAPGRSGATTGAAAWVSSSGLGWFTRVGDCRVHHWRSAPAAATGLPAGVVLTLAATDQTFALLDEAPPPGVPPHNPARMVGNGRMGQPEVQALQLQPGDGLLLSSDGLHDVLGTDLLCAAIARVQAGSGALPQLGRLLERLARQRGSRDDIALVLLRWWPTPHSAPPPPLHPPSGGAAPATLCPPSTAL